MPIEPVTYLSALPAFRAWARICTLPAQHAARRIHRKKKMHRLSRPICLFALLVFLQLKPSQQATSTRPFYNIAYMANNISEADNFLENGANGLSVDVQFTLNGTPTFTYRGAAPCTCNRNCGGFQVFSDFLDYLRLRTKAGKPNYLSRLAIVHMNLRVSGLVPASLSSAGEKLAKELIDHLFGWGAESSEPWIVLGVPFLSQAVLFKSLRETFLAADLGHHLERIGYDIYHYGRLERLRSTMKSAGVTEHVWVGTGSGVCRRRFVPDRLLNLVTRREAITMFGNPFMDRVYYWVADEPSAIREVFKLGVDAVMTNRPDTVNEIMQSSDFENKVRLADNKDIPWGKTFAKKKDANTSSYNLLLSIEGNSVEKDGDEKDSQAEGEDVEVDKSSS